MEAHFPNAVGADYTPFPSPSSTQHPVVDTVLKHRIPWFQQQSPELAVSTLIRAAWALVAGSQTNSNDAVFGVAVSGRRAHILGSDEKPASAITALPLCLRWTSDQTVSELLEEVRLQSVNINPFRQTGSHQVNKAHNDGLEPALLQTLLITQRQENSHEQNVFLGSQQQAGDAYALVLDTRLGVNKITVTASFDSRLIKPWIVKKVLERLQYVMHQLRSIARDKRIKDIQMVSEWDLKEIWGWNGTVPEPVDRCVHDIVEEWSHSQPEAPAVCAWDGELTYGELNRLSAALAIQLIELGVGPDILVPLCFEKSMWTTVATLGVLKAGGGFVLLDPSLPEQRLQTMCRQVRSKLLLSSTANMALSSSLSDIVVEVGPGRIEPLAKTTSSMTASPSSSNIMYAVFTSGSTGTPKGVLLSHRNFCSAMKYQLPFLDITKDSRVLDFASYTFDVAVHNAFATLIAGACLCVPADKDRKNNIGKVLTTLRPTLANLTPTVSRLLDPTTVPPCLKTLILLGEAVTAGDAERWFGKIHLINTYGPAECTPISTINSTASTSDEAVRIGKGEGLLTWVVDPHNHHNLLPIGCVGELLLEGPPVGCGYLNDPIKTAEAFIEDPEWLLQGLSNQPDRPSGRRGRLYKTGDLVRYNHDGSLTFVGRKDAQIKIRGQRVELGDVEHHIQNAMPDVLQVVAEIIMPQGESSNPVLAAFLQLNDNTTVTNESETLAASVLPIGPDVEDMLAESLPSYMIPTLFFSMPKLPMTPSGKINRKQLRDYGGKFSSQDLAEMQMAGKGPKRQPTSKTERQMQRIWGTVLHIDFTIIGLDDAFFRLGGDSAAAIRVVAEARLLGLELSVADIFQHRTLDAVSSHAVYVADNPQDDIPPFSLLGDNLHSTSLINAISDEYQLDSATIQDVYPCTPLQEGFISLSAKQPGDYIMQDVLELPQDIRIHDFRNAWERVVQAMPILRTRIVQNNTVGLLQVVCDQPIHWVEATGLDDYLSVNKKQPMDMGQPLARYALIEEGENQWFVWTVHHALYDGWSLPLVTETVSQVYRGDSIASIPDFKRFIKYIRGQDDEKITGYWRDTLADYDKTPFPTLSPSIQQPIANSEISHQFPNISGQSLNVTTSTLIYAAWALVTSRQTNTDDVVFGVTVSGRNAPVPDIHNIPGPTIATVPFRIQVANSQKVTEFLEGIQLQTTEMIPFEQTGLHRIAKISPECQQACTFQTLLIVQSEETGSIQELGKWQDNLQEEQINTYALVLDVQLGSNDIKITARFDSRLIEPWIAETLLQRLESVVCQLGKAHPQQSIKQISLITPQDLETVWKWNSTVPAPVEKCVHEIIETIARERPDAPAICAWDGDLTYGELNRLATQLAGKLVGLGVGPDMLVPLCFEKSMWTTVAILGVMKAGGGFLLLEPSLPQQRLQAIIEQVNASLILSSPLNQALSLQLVDNVLTINADFFTGPELNYKADSLFRSPTPSSVIYAIFTSGSTGTPKGILVTHRNIATAVYHQAASLGYTTETRVYDFASYSFDAHLGNAFTILTVGGCLCVPSDLDRKNRLQESITSLRANATELTPSVAQLLDPKKNSELKTLIFGGEAVYLNHVLPWWENTRVINTYGPSECTATSTINITASTPEEATRIGHGIGVATWVADPENHDILLPPGCIGELLIEGPLVSRGYLNNPEKTAAAFIDDPLWLMRGLPGRQEGRHGRLYKTGDLVQYSNDGSLTFLGRKDAQVKIRGQRVELGEVEQCIQRYIPEAAQVVAEVIVPQGEKSSATLAAFLQMDNMPETDNLEIGVNILPVSATIEEQLLRHLPVYMIPTVFFSLQKLPMMPSGKMNRKGLREIGASITVQQLAEIRTAGQGLKRQPETQSELHMQRIWGQILNIDPSIIGLDDSFFRLGGDSIMAMKVVGEARKAGIELRVADIFSFPKLGDVAGKGLSLADNTPEDIPPFALLGNGFDVASLLAEHQLDPSTVEDAYPCTPLQEGLLSLSSKQQGDYIMQNIIEISPDINIRTFCEAWEKVIQEISILRTKIVQHSDVGLVQLVLKEKVHWIESNNLEEYLSTDKKLPMTIGQNLTRYALIKDETSMPRWFVWTIHHALYDGWSLPFVINRVGQVYSGETISPIPEFKRFIKYIREQGDHKMEDYWRNAFADYDDTPFPAPISTQQPVADTTIQHQLQKIQTQSSDITASTLVRAAWALVAGRQANCNDVVFGVTVSGRNAPIVGIDEIAGPTIATLPLRIKLAKDQLVSEYLEAIQQQAIEMIPFEQIGLHRIPKISPESQQASTFQTLLIVQPEDNSSAYNVLGKWKDGSLDDWSNTYALVLEIQLGSDNVTVTATFDSKVIKPWLVEKLLQRLDYVMQQLGNPEQKIADIGMVTKKDLEEVWEWNKSVLEPVQRCVHEIIEDKAQSQADAPAICAWDGELTYSELDRLATKLASHLVNLGVGPDTIVPLCFEKSMWTVVGLVGILKAGGAFLLLDPSLPEQRLQVMVQQVKARVILSSPSNQSLSSRLAETVVVVNAEVFVDLETDSENQINKHFQRATPSSMMYVIFTSGSTGTPKGVIITHMNAASGLPEHAKGLSYTSESRIFDFASYSFGASINNTFACLTSGGCVCIPSDHDRKSNLAGSLSSLRATSVLLTPSVAESLSPEKVPGLKSLIFGGEAVYEKNVMPWWGKVQYFTAYGSSECTTISTINSNPPSLDKTNRIGKGVGLVTWIVDPEDHHNLLPPGCIGELLLEGPLISRGYLNDPEKTAAVFIEDPKWLLGGLPGRKGRNGRLYKTGDLVQYNEDGSLTFLGRKDAQVKIRGQRVELGEVEYFVREHTQAKQVAVDVIVPQGENASPALAAFLLLNDTAESQESEPVVANIVPIDASVEEKLISHLPSYMIPTVFFSMSKLPMTSTGKMHRKQLREIGSSFSVQQLAEIRTAGQGPKRQPRTYIEKTIQSIWGQVLDIDPKIIGLDDSFLRLGGDSISAMKVVGEARKVGIDLKVADIFRHPTLVGNANHANTGENHLHEHLEEESLIDPVLHSALLEEIDGLDANVSSASVAEILPLTSFQEMWLTHALTYHDLFYDYFHADLGATVDVSRLERSCALTLERLPVLRACYLPLVGSLWQVTLKDLDLPFRIIDVNEDLDKSLADFRHEDMQDISTNSPPIAFVLLRHKAQGIRFVMRMSHCQYDGASIPKILESLVTGYNDEPFSQPPSFSTYLSYAAHRRSASIDYWRDLLQDSTVTELPTQVFDGDLKGTRVDKKMLRPQLPENITLASLLSAAWTLTLSHVTGKQDVVAAHLLNGRNSAFEGVDEVVEPCINIVPLRFRLQDLQTTSDLLLAVQGQFHAIEESDSLGFKDIVQHCTDWPAGTGVDSVIQHQHLDTTPDVIFADVKTTLNCFDEPHWVYPCTWVITHPEGDHVHIRIMAPTMSTEKAEVLLEGYISIIEKLSEALDKPLLSCIDGINFEM